MKLSPDALATSRYTLLDKLDHHNLIPFIQRYLYKRTFSTLLYLFFNLAGIIGTLVYIIVLIRDGNISIGNSLSHLSYGIALTFLLIPLHEFIHVLAYKSQGAVNTSYDANLKKFYFLAIADKFVASKKEFRIVALAPFVVISIGLFVLFPFVTINWQISLLGIFITHTACCSGDFGMLGYFDYHKDKIILTYDDKEEKTTYFYAVHQTESN
jgi:hypothetical protein